MKKIGILLVSFIAFTSCQGQNKTKAKENVVALKVQKTEEEWKKQLTTDQYEVLRNKGTERPFTGEYVNNFRKGKYVCVACGNLLFNSNAKFKSDCGWPSFDQAVKGAVTYVNDTSFGMVRIEVNCASCGGHLGHVFDDGPEETTGKRFCTNSVSIQFIPEK
ncbi:MAG TPA: peptide-methionine (R)-S-oxide reductase MsrB [Flavobacterium sp.]|jgi:peptide-methionine (R)-S-oxide reductase